MEMRFDAATGDVNEQRGHQHLAGCNDVPRHDSRWIKQRQSDGQHGNYTPEDNGGPKVNMNGTRSATPGARGDDDGSEDSAGPLQEHEDSKNLAGVTREPIALLLNQSVSRDRDRVQLCLVWLIAH